LKTSRVDDCLAEIERDHDMPIYDGVPGGQELLRWFGLVPSFHDAEVLGFYLNRNGPSVLRLHWWITTNRTRADGYFMLEKHTLVTFTLQGIMDLQLENFSAQNVIGGLNLRRATDRPDRRNHLTLDPLPQDIEIELEPCYGLCGFIRARSVAITFEPSEPTK
jgi:hypothetical protein